MKKNILKGILAAAALVSMSWVSAQTIYIPGGLTGIGTNSIPDNQNVGIGVANVAQALTHRLTVGGDIRWANSVLSIGQSGSIELGGLDNATGGGSPFIDFHGGTELVSDFTARIWSVKNDQFMVTTPSFGPVLSVSGSSVLIGADPNAVPYTTLFTNCPNQSLKLFVNGTLGAREVRVSTTAWCDYVFSPNYKLKPLQEVEKYIQTYMHLPEVPSEKEVTENGIAIGEMMKIQMKKIEELTLYLIELKKENELLRNQNQRIMEMISK